MNGILPVSICNLEIRNGRVNWGILGTARIAHDYVIPSILESRNAKVVAIAGRSEEKVATFSDKFAIPKRYKSYDELLRSPDVDAVYIPLTNNLHHNWTIKAAESQKHVLCEKPLAMSSVECREMIAACKSNGVFLMEGFMYRFHPQIDLLFNKIESGSVGKVNEVRSSFWFRLDDFQDFRYQKELGGGALMDLGCYCIDLSRILLRSEPSSVASFSKMNERKEGLDEITLGLMHFPNSRFAYFDCGFLAPLYNPLQIIGSEGILELTEAFEFPRHPRLLIFQHNSPTPTQTIDLEKANPYKLMVEHFADCILNDRSPKFSAEEGMNNLRVIEKLRESRVSVADETPAWK